jgi:hypothetical protein
LKALFSIETRAAWFVRHQIAKNITKKGKSGAKPEK